LRFANFFSGGFIAAILVANPPESKVAKRTSVQCKFEISRPIRKLDSKSSSAFGRLVQVNLFQKLATSAEHVVY